jgi:predicted phosphodiesterase
MKFRLLSDLHLEFEDRVTDFTPMPQKDEKTTVLILAGDIALGIEAVPFIKQMCKRFYKVVYCLGNHEFYYNEYNKTRARWNDMAEMPGNFILLDDHVAIIDDVRLVGGTLWTDFSGGDYFAKSLAQHGMNDYNCAKIKEQNEEGKYFKRKLHPNDTVLAHMQTLMLIRETVRVPFEGPTVVITHHLPHPLCVAQQFRSDPLNPAYVTNLDYVIEANEIAVWVHGHTHTNVDVEVHGTRILCNPRGYTPDDLNDEFDENFTFEV